MNFNNDPEINSEESLSVNDNIDSVNYNHNKAKSPWSEPISSYFNIQI